MSLEDRFWAKVGVRGLDDCWEWTASRDGHGYGKLARCHGCSPYKAHRLSYEMFVGEIPAGLEVLHSCDNPPCVNPRHLFLGTQQDNMDDMVKKGRAHGKQQQGEDNPAAKLNCAQVAAIRWIWSNGQAESMAELGRSFGVSGRAVKFILDGEHWRNC